MSSSSEHNPLQFAVQVLPRAAFRRDDLSGTQPIMEAAHARCRLEGWFLPPVNTTVHGMRAVLGKQTATVRRKQLRPDVLRMHPQRPDALHSGFKVELILNPGLNHVTLQYKDDQKQWRHAGSCYVRLSWLWRWKRLWSRHVPQNEYECWVQESEATTAGDLEKSRSASKLLPKQPLISVLMPTWNTPEIWLSRAIESVRAQTYPNWELCVADDASTHPHVRKVLEKAARLDSRIRVAYRAENGHICHATNTALEMCSGEFAALLDHDDELSPDALFQMASEIAAEPEVDVLFSDEDKIDNNGTRFDPCFKSGWNPELLLHENCFNHLGVFRTQLLREIGGFRPGYEGAQDWDLVLRATSRVPRQHIRHIPRVLYHWRAVETSTAASAAAKPYAVEAGKRAIRDHLAQHQPGAELIDGPESRWRIAWPLPSPLPLVSIIIPTRDRVDLLRVALDSLLGLTAYTPYEIVIVDHQSSEPETLAYLQMVVRSHSSVSVIRAEGPFNWSRLNNLGVSHSRGDILVFLNNDVEITDAHWLRELAGSAWRSDVGAVGACLLYPDGSIQHAGIVLGMTGLAGHVFRGSRIGTYSLGCHPNLPREVTAVTGACLAVRRSCFDRVGGFDEEKLPVSYNDVDFCLRLRAQGLRNIYTPFSRLIHHESVSRRSTEQESARKAAATEEARVVLDRWPNEFRQDAFYNPNVSSDSEFPTLGPPHGVRAHETSGVP